MEGKAEKNIVQFTRKRRQIFFICCLSSIWCGWKKRVPHVSLVLGLFDFFPRRYLISIRGFDFCQNNIFQRFYEGLSLCEDCCSAQNDIRNTKTTPNTNWAAILPRSVVCSFTLWGALCCCGVLAFRRGVSAKIWAFIIFTVESLCFSAFPFFWHWLCFQMWRKKLFVPSSSLSAEKSKSFIHFVIINYLVCEHFSRTRRGARNKKFLPSWTGKKTQIQQRDSHELAQERRLYFTFTEV